MPSAFGNRPSSSKDRRAPWSQDRSNPIASRSHAGTTRRSPPAPPRPPRSARPPNRWGRRWPASTPVLARSKPPPDDPSPDSISTTETVSSVAARSRVVPERLRSWDTCSTEPLVACDSTPAAEPSVGVTPPPLRPPSEPALPGRRGRHEVEGQVGRRLVAGGARVEIQQAVGDPAEAQPSGVGHFGARDGLGQAQAAGAARQQGQLAVSVVADHQVGEPIVGECEARGGRIASGGKLCACGLAEPMPEISVPLFEPALSVARPSPRPLKSPMKSEDGAGRRGSS